jgi:hypothetical protein
MDRYLGFTWLAIGGMFLTFGSIDGVFFLPGSLFILVGLIWLIGSNAGKS